MSSNTELYCVYCELLGVYSAEMDLLPFAVSFTYMKQLIGSDIISLTPKVEDALIKYYSITATEFCEGRHRPTCIRFLH